MSGHHQRRIAAAAGGEITFVDSTEGVGSATFALPTSLQDDYLVLITGSDTKTHPRLAKQIANVA